MVFAAQCVFVLWSYKAQGSGAWAHSGCSAAQGKAACAALGWEAELLLAEEREEVGGKEPDKPERAVDICLTSFKGGKTALPSISSRIAIS